MAARGIPPQARLVHRGQAAPPRVFFMHQFRTLLQKRVLKVIDRSVRLDVMCHWLQTRRILPGRYNGRS
ncbi:MAG: hypothetical protein JSV03_14475, partial [Planctomycetota bacterium]